jgi:hypothetical protein
VVLRSDLQPIVEACSCAGDSIAEFTGDGLPCWSTTCAGFDDGGAATWDSVMPGFSVILYSLLTDYELRLVRRIPVPTHFALDRDGGVLLAVSPWLFGFADRVWSPHLIIGLVQIGTALMSQCVPSNGPSEQRRNRKPVGVPSENRLVLASFHSAERARLLHRARLVRAIRAL